jgi:hypothetical protein
MSNLSIARPSPIFYGEVALAAANSGTFTSSNLFPGTSKVLGLKAFTTASVAAAKAGTGALVKATPANTLHFKSLTTTAAGTSPYLATGTVVSGANETLTVFIYWTNETNNDVDMLNC